MFSIAVLASTSGTDLQAIIDEMKAGTLDIDLKCVISNKEDCFALERTRNEGHDAIFLDAKGKEREEYDKEVSAILEEKGGVDLIILVGYMRLFSPWFVQKYENKILNVHPSLLPSFTGMDLDVHQSVIDYGCKVTGMTIHLVDEGMDTGPIVCQKAIDIAEGETPDTLKPKVQDLEKKWFPEVIRWFQDGKVSIEGKKVRINA